MNKHSMYTKLVIFGCTISIIPLIVLGIFSYSKSSNSIQNHVNENSIHTMNQMNTNVEQILRTVDRTMMYIINSNTVQEMIYRPFTYKQFQIYNQLNRELSFLQSPDTNVSGVILASYETGWLMNNLGLYELDTYEYADWLLQFKNTKQNTIWTVVETEKVGTSESLNLGCDYTIALIKMTPIITNVKKGIAAATIPSCQLTSLIDVPSSSDVMVLDENNTIVIHQDSKKIGMTLTDLNDISKEDLAYFDSDSGQFLLDKANPVSVTYVKSKFNGWTYVSFTELSEYTKESRSIGWFTFFVCLFIIIITVLFVWLGSQRVYHPIRQLFMEISHRLPGESKNKNEIQIINDHVRDLFHSNTKLTQELSQNSEQIINIFLHNLLIGNSNFSDTEASLKQYGLNEHTSKWRNIVALTLQIDLLDDTRFEHTDHNLLLFAIKNIIEEMISIDNRLPTIIVNHTHVTLLGSEINESNEFNNYVYHLTEQIQTNMKAYLSLDVSIGISLPFQSIHIASRAYHEGMEALKHRMKLGKGVIISYFSLNSGNHRNVYFYPKQIENELIDAIRLADEKNAHAILKDWLNEVFKGDRAPHEYQISLICLLNELMIVMQEAGIPQKQISSGERSLYEQLLTIYFSSEIESWFKSNVIAPMISVFKDRQESQYHNLSEQIIDMIQHEFDQDLTLEDCASRLHYNVFYLSNIFKKETGLSFSEYLANYRLNKAKKWLIETDLSIKDIAQKLTYNNPQNFIRYFRKLEGITPGQYRKNYERK